MLLIMSVRNRVEVLRNFDSPGFFWTRGNSPDETSAPGFPGFTCLLSPSQTKLLQYGGAAMYCKVAKADGRLTASLHSQYLQFLFSALVC